MLKRMLSLFLSLAMVLSLLPAQAIALETEEPIDNLQESEPLVEETIAEETEPVAEPEPTEETASVEEETEPTEETIPAEEETEPAEEATELVEEETTPTEEVTEATEEATQPTEPEEASEPTNPTDPIEPADPTEPTESKDILSGICGNNLTWEFDVATGILTIWGSGHMYDYSEEYPAPWNIFSDEIKEITFSSSIDRIGAYAFENCTSLTSVILPGEDSLYLGAYAFAGCTNLKEITFLGRISHPIAEGIFKNVTATAYYPAGRYWNESEFEQLGGELTWIETGSDARYLRIDRWGGIRVGEEVEVSIYTSPWDSTCDCVFSVNDSSILEIVSVNQKSCILKGIKAGTAVLTVTDKRTGLSVEKEFVVSQPEPIKCPYIEEYTFDKDTVFVVYSFTPEESSLYKMTLSGYSMYNDGLQITVYNVDEYVGSVFLPDGNNLTTYTYLEKGITYSIQVSIMAAYSTKDATFVLEKCNDQFILNIHEKTIEHNNYLPNKDISGRVYADYIGVGDVQWTCSDTSILEISNATNTECEYNILQPGTAIITATCGDVQDSVKIIVTEQEFLQLYEEYNVDAVGSYESYGFSFIAPTEGKYVFSLENVDPAFCSLRMKSYHTDDVNYSYSEDAIYVVRKMDAEEMCELSVNIQFSNGILTVSHAIEKPYSLKIVELEDGKDQITIGASFAPQNSSERIVKWEISDSSIIGEYMNPTFTYRSDNQIEYEVYQSGEVTVTATSESGLTTSYTLTVGECLNGHDFSEFTPVIDKSGDPTGNEYRTCSRCDITEQRKILPLAETVANRLTLDPAEFNDHSVVWIDGAEMAIQKDGDSWYIDLPDGNARVMTTYEYVTDGTSEDSVAEHVRYPVSMRVWTLENRDGVYTATHQTEFDDILQYSGVAIRVTGKKGIRMITSIDAGKKASLTGDGLAGYTLLEYGTAVAWADQLGSTKPLTLGKSWVSSNYAYKKDVADPVFRQANGVMQYTNVLVNFSNEQCADDIAMRPYMILADAEGNEITIYGGIVNRSIGYIALRNRNAFKSDTDPYDYLWDIIHYVYGDAYDADWQPSWTDTIM